MKVAALCGCVPAVLVLAAVAGCQKSAATVSGTVTFEGQPVADGYITFTPTDGTGQPVGAEIKQGKYEITQITPGRKIVKITGGQQVQFPRSSEEAAQLAAQGKPVGEVNNAAAIPENAVGNNAEATISDGEQTLDFALKRPAAQ